MSRSRPVRKMRAWRSPDGLMRSSRRPGSRSPSRRWMRVMPTPRSSGLWRIARSKASCPPRRNRRQARSSRRGGSSLTLTTTSYAVQEGKLQRGAFQHFQASARDCGRCPLRPRCVSASRHSRVVVLNLNHASLLRARRKRLHWSKRENRLYQRHRWRVEGVHGEAKTWHGLARAVRRGLDNIRIQAFLTAAAINLKRLAAAFLALILYILRALAPLRAPRHFTSPEAPRRYRPICRRASCV